ncbi:MAG: LytR C-terminal domain-containing protein [Solirubrobacteraceae bacterium]
MGAIAYALSVSHFVNSVGAKAGFAAIIAVALLVLLFFAQMRETASLRDRAAASDEHVQQLEQRVAQLSRGMAAVTASSPAVVPAPAGVSRAPVVPAPAAVAAAAATGAVASRTVRPPSAPAGVGAPALSSATRLIPSEDESPISIRATGPGVAVPVAAGVAAAAVGAGAGSGGAVAAPPAPRPATAAGGANGGPVTRPPAPVPAPAPPPASARPAQSQRPPVRSGAPRAPLTTSRPTGSGSASRIRAGLMIAAGAAVVAVVVIVLLNATSGGTSTGSSSAANSTHGSHHGARVDVPLKPADVSVTVLNGTETTNLAHDITQRLAGSGYKTGTPATATDQTVGSTVVGYRGRSNRAAALLVARSLKLGPASVQPVGQSNLAVACPQTSTCTAQVIVTVGADLASAAGTGTTGAST